MDRTELFLALIVFLLAILIYETGDGNTPEFIVITILLIIFVFPFYIVGALLIENVINT